MNDFHRLNQGGAQGPAAEFTTLLISSAQSEEPSSHAQHAVLASLGLAGAALGLAAPAQATAAVVTTAGVTGGTASGTAASGTAAVGTAGVGTGATGAAAAGASAAGASATTAGSTGASTLLKVAALKWVGVTLVGGGVVVGAGSQLIGNHAAVGKSAQSTAAAVAVVAPQAITRNSIAEAKPQIAPAEPTTPDQGTAEPNIIPEAKRPLRARPEGTGSETAAAGPSVLAQEVLLLDRARESFAAGRSVQAKGLAQEYIRSFPRGSLLPEAVFLKMQSERNLGHTAEATASARELLRIAPHSPQASAAQEFLANKP
ncbi:MAG TPA: hypothetical protein VL137_09350 [Polyangiaceae bacterium]|nr:hypothetical protein [Polyangiaceae bacterium]